MKILRVVLAFVTFVVFLLMVLCTHFIFPAGYMVKLDGKWKQFSRTQYILKPKKRTIFLLTGARSGSSFLGHVVAMSKEVFFLYEPLNCLHHLHNMTHVNQDRPKALDDHIYSVLSDISNCRFQSQEEFVKAYFLNNNFWKKTKELKTISRKSLGDPVVYEDICNNQRQNTVMKILSFRLPTFGVEGIKEIIEKQSMDRDFRIIYLVRDPRAMFSSFVNLGWLPDHTSEVFHKAVRLVCQATQKDLEKFLNPQPWLQDKFKVLTYEDMARYPVVTMRDVFEFSGLDFSEDIKVWIKNNTEVSASHNVFNSAYSLKRNSSAMVNKWRNAPRKRIDIIQELCGDVLRLLNYSMWNSQEIQSIP